MNFGQYKIIDAHCDTLHEAVQRNLTLDDDALCVSLSKLRRYGGFVQFFAAWINDAESRPFKRAELLIDKFYEELAANRKAMMQILTAEDFESALENGRIGAMLTVENGNCLEGELANIHKLYQWGVRAMTLSWNGSNELADGIDAESKRGLSDFGKMVVKEMNRLGMMIDVSHLSERGFWDVLELSEIPVMASHSNSRKMATHRRNLTDDQIRALSEKGGVLGLNFYPPFLTDKSAATVSDCIRHIEHILKIGGEDCLVFGSDFDGFSEPAVYDLQNAGCYGGLLSALELQGYGPTFLEKLTHKNMLTFVKKVLQ